MGSYSICPSFKKHLASFTQHNIHAVTSERFPTFLRLNNISLYTYTIFSLSIYLFFFHLSIDGHLGCFHIFATANNVARSHIYEVIKIDKFIETENRIMIFRGKGRENGELLFNKFKISLRQDE